MNRRDFLFLRRTPKGKTLELSCHNLYIRTLKSSAPTTQPADVVYEHEPWMGEPPVDFQKIEGEDWFFQIENQLREVDVLKLVDEKWLNPTGLGARLEPLLASFRARGGRVERGEE